MCNIRNYFRFEVLPVIGSCQSISRRGHRIRLPIPKLSQHPIRAVRLHVDVVHQRGEPVPIGVVGPAPVREVVWSALSNSTLHARLPDHVLRKQTIKLPDKLWVRPSDLHVSLDPPRNKINCYIKHYHEPDSNLNAIETYMSAAQPKSTHSGCLVVVLERVELVLVR